MLTFVSVSPVATLHLGHVHVQVFVAGSCVQPLETGPTSPVVGVWPQRLFAAEHFAWSGSW